jgi:cytochrome c5
MGDDREVCYFCRCPFTDEEWDQRHSDATGEDVHEECCDICHGDDAAHRTRVAEPLGADRVIWHDGHRAATTWGSLASAERERKARQEANGG